METWSTSWALRNFIAELLMPPGIWILCLLLLIFFIKKYDRLKKSFITLGLIMIWITSTNYFANHFTNLAGVLLEWPSPLDQSKLLSSNFSNYTLKPQAIVILGGGRRKGALEVAEYQNQDVSSQTMERLRLGARLAKLTDIPVLVSAGAPDRVSKNELTESEIMKLVMQNELGIKVKWVENQSNTTEENAIYSAILLKNEGIQNIFLVTHFWHMPRAKVIFEKVGLNIVEAPIGFYQKQETTPLDFYPGSEGIQQTRWVWHEVLGNLWYRIKS
jgi:uncharacterized SAM-binding protein YcdF (DUF218 family)